MINGLQFPGSTLSRLWGKSEMSHYQFKCLVSMAINSNYYVLRGYFLFGGTLEMRWSCSTCLLVQEKKGKEIKGIFAALEKAPILAKVEGKRKGQLTAKWIDSVYFIFYYSQLWVVLNATLKDRVREKPSWRKSIYLSLRINNAIMMYN